jgi:hypothetical protein
MPRPPRKAFKTRRQAFQIGLQKEGIETLEHLTPGKRVKVRENAKKLLRENDQKARMCKLPHFLDHSKVERFTNLGFYQ